MTSKKLCRHVIGTTHKPIAIVECNGSFFCNDKSLALLSDKEIEEYEDAQEDWLQKEAQVQEIIYSTIDQSNFHQVKGELTVANIWKRLTTIHSNKGAMF